VGESHLCEETYAAIRKTIENNQAVGVLAGYYDRDLTIAYISEFFLHNLGYTYEEFMEKFSGSLKNVFCGQNCTFAKIERFKKIHGVGEAQMLNKEGAPVNVRVYKKDTIDSEGNALWILSTHIDEMQENLELVNQVLSSGFWSVECAQSGNPESVFFSHEFRKMLGYHDTLDFPNNLETWERGIHPRDLEEVSRTFQEAFQDKTNEKKYDVEYRMRMADGTYQWFKDKGEVSRRADGTAFRMAGIFINIDAEKRARQYTQRVDAFYRAYTTANLCEYYVDLQENSFNSLKVEETLSGLFEESSTWDELIDLPVLVVDDDQNCCENTVALLEEIGIDGEWVTSGEEAVNLVAARYEKENDYFAIIIDWKMPGMDGLETTRQIRKIVGNDVTIIILSAYDYSEIAKEIIGMTGAEVVTAENGKTAVDMISSGSEGDFDLIFMDIQMPVMNGYEATAAIRTSNIPAARSVPIVAMTANAFAEDVQLARSAGMNEHISKPLDMTRLRDVMRKWL
jgi:Response regulator receiver domain